MPSPKGDKPTEDLGSAVHEEPIPDPPCTLGVSVEHVSNDEKAGRNRTFTDAKEEATYEESGEVVACCMAA